MKPTNTADFKVAQKFFFILEKNFYFKNKHIYKSFKHLSLFRINDKIFANITMYKLKQNNRVKAERSHKYASKATFDFNDT
jgi:hypothetical protein